MLGCTQLDTSQIFLFNWLIVLFGLTLLGIIVTSASRRWPIASRHCLALALLAMFLAAPIALVIASIGFASHWNCLADRFAPLPIQMAYACMLLRQIPGLPLDATDVLQSWIVAKGPWMLRASAAIAMAELDRDAAIDDMLLMIEEITRDENSDKA